MLFRSIGRRGAHWPIRKHPISTAILNATLAVEGHVFERMRPNENLTVQVVPESELCQHELSLLQYVKMTITDMHWL